MGGGVMADLRIKTIEQLFSKQLMALPLSKMIRKDIFCYETRRWLR